jgi:hypothetical protein
MVKYMVPILKTKGYTFVRVDEVPDIAALLPRLVAAAPDGGPSDSGVPPLASGGGATPADADASAPSADPCAR